MFCQKPTFPVQSRASDALCAQHPNSAAAIMTDQLLCATASLCAICKRSIEKEILHMSCFYGFQSGLPCWFLSRFIL